jgi:hypothetical protein
VTQIISNGTVEGLDYQTLVAKNGFYAYLKAKDDTDYLFRSNVQNDAGRVLVDAAWPIDDPSGFVVVRVDVQSAGSDSATVAPGMDFILREYQCVEFQTPSQSHERHLAESNYSDYVAMMAILRLLPVMFENPSHVEQLKQAVRGAYNTLRVHSGGIAAVLSKVHPAFAALGALGALPQW